MKLFQIALGLCLVALTVCGGTATAADPKPAKPEPVNMPMVGVTETDFDFGRVVQDASVSHGYWIRNVGGDTLRIADVKPGCGCTKAPIEKKELAVGDSTRVELIFSTGKMTNVVRKSATIMSNAAGLVPRLAFSADVRPNPDSLEIYTVVPPRLDMTKAKPQDQKTPWEYQLTLKNTTDIGLTFTLVSAPDQYVTVDLPHGKIVNPGEEATFAVRIDPASDAVNLVKSFTIEASDDARTRMSIPIFKPSSSPMSGTETSAR